MLRFNRNEKNNLTVSFIIPEGKIVEERICEDSEVKTPWDIMYAFRERLMKSLQRRMQACEQNLINHITSCTKLGDVIYWKRKDGSTGAFNVFSYETMEKAYGYIDEGRFTEFLESPEMIDQMLKALLNDTEQDHSDCEGFRYSELCSTLLSLLSEGGEK